MTTKEFNAALQVQFNKMQPHKLYRSSISGNQVWELYINGFLAEENPIFRDPNSSTYNCNNDKNFLRRYGNIVAITSAGELLTLFDFEVSGDYKTTIPKLAKVLRHASVSEIFVETFDELHNLSYEKTNKNQSVYQLGVVKTLKQYTREEVEKFGVVTEGKIYEFNHFHMFLDGAYVDASGKSAEALMAAARDAKNVFQRAMVEIPLDTLELVRDLIIQGSLLNGNTYLAKVNEFITLKKEYDSFAGDKDLWCWYKSLGLPIAKFRNEVIGTLCQDLAEGMEINAACQSWNKKVDPVNFMKATTLVTKRQIQESEKKIEELGYTEAITSRRFAELSDIAVSEIKHKNVDGKQVIAGGLFEKVKQQSTSTRYKKAEFNGVETVTIEKFMKDILPSCTSVSLLLENKHQNNLVALLTGEGKNMFKWNNPFSWTYSNNLTGVSKIAENVTKFGSKIDGALRFSIMWADGDGDNSDLDAHCQTRSNHIYHGNKCGILDVDIRYPKGKLAVENIVFQKLSGNNVYKFYVNQYSEINSKGFHAEIVVNGETFTYHYDKRVVGNVPVATVTVVNDVATIKHHLPANNANKTIWNLQTGEFHKCNLICNSPNHWGENNVGNLHYFFMLDGCKSDIALRPFHAEYLNSELYENRKTLDMLAHTIMVNSADKQLAGVGFNSTIEDEVILKLEGSHKRIIKVKIK